MKPVIIHSEAIEELDAAVAYYEDQKAGLGLDFLVEYEAIWGKAISIKDSAGLDTDRSG